MFRQQTRNGQGMSYTVSKIFIDTNLIVYTLDKSNANKQERARTVIREIVDVHLPVISTQVIKEIYVVAINKMKADPIIVKNIIHNFRNMEIVTNDIELIEQAIDISVISQVSFWDSLIIAAAEKAKCEYIFSEDLNPGQTYRGILVVNPFETGDNLF